jgi:hypothetical protein
MSTILPPPNGKINFAGMVGPKRRRMRSGGNVSTLTNNNAKTNMMGGNNSIDEDPEMDPMMDDEDDDDDEKTAQTSKCKGATTIPIFLKSKSWKIRPKRCVAQSEERGFYCCFLGLM